MSFWDTASPAVAISGTVAENLTQVLGAALSATNPLVTELSDGTNIVGTATHPLVSEISDGTNILGTTAHPFLNRVSAPAAADIVVGFRSDTATTAAATLVTVPAGRTWQGVIAVDCSVQTVAATATAGLATGTITTAGTGVTPAAGTVFQVSARNGANAATGTAAAQGNNANNTTLTVVAPVGNAVTIQAASSIAGTQGTVNFSAIGSLIA